MIGEKYALTDIDGLATVQELCVRLYFDDELQRAWIESPSSVVHRFTLPEKMRRMIPDVSTDAFQAESHGRRFLVAREVGRRFLRTMEYLHGRELELGELARSSMFQQFMASDSFLTKKFGLPHPGGLGPGYEAISKFFFWTFNRYGLSSPNCDQSLRLLLLAEFGRQLVASAQTSPCPKHAPFRPGMYFTIRHDRSEKIVLIDQDSKVSADHMEVTTPAVEGLHNMDMWIRDVLDAWAGGLEGQ